MSSSSIQALPKDRIAILDVLRGFALAGVLLANLEGFVTFALPDTEVAAMTSTLADSITEHFLHLFVSGKFISIFSMLFGYGFGILIEKTAAKGIPVNRFFLVRMAWLLVIGLLHLCIWQGDILNVYASCGMLLLLFRKASTRSILTLGLCFLLLGGPMVQGLKIYLLDPNPPERDVVLANYVAAVKSGNLMAIVKNNYQTIWYIYFERWAQFRDMFETLGRFLIGFWLVKTNMLTNLPSKRQVFKKTFWFTLAVSAIYLAEQVYTSLLGNAFASNAGKLMEYAFTRLGILAMALFYCCTIMLLFMRGEGKGFSFWKYVGKMSLSNYLIHSLFYSFLFYGFGLALLGKVHLYWIVPVGLFIYTLQVLWSWYWMQHFNYGPFEWVWRQLTYGRRLPLKKQAA